jgi:hypothetical protein
LTGLRVIRPLDADDFPSEVNALPLECHQLPEAEAGVHRRGPECASVIEGCKKPRRLLRRHDALAAPADGRKLQPRGRVDRYLPSNNRAPEDRAER